MAEVFLSHSFEREGISYIIEGRADGIIVPLGSSLYQTTTIDEIKTTSQPLERIHEDYTSFIGPRLSVTAIFMPYNRI